LRVLVDIKHPAEVHFFGPLIQHLHSRNDSVLVTIHNKFAVAELLASKGIEYRKISEVWNGPWGIVATAGVRSLKILKLARNFRPHVMVARVGAEIGLVGRMLRIPAISFDENEYASVQLTATRVLAHVLCTGMGYEKPLGKKQRRFHALPQFTYTHPARFSPSMAGLQFDGFDPTRPYVVLRLGAWSALHDIGKRGMSEEDALRLVEHLSPHARVLVSRADGLPPRLRPYGHNVPTDRNLDLLAFASLYIGEGGSMAAEAACLGTPALWVSPIECGYLNVLAEKYGLIEKISDPGKVRERAEAWLCQPALRERAAEGHRRLLADSEDPLEFMVKVVDEYGLNGGRGAPPDLRDRGPCQ
jgi:hypothetical protein